MLAVGTSKLEEIAGRIATAARAAGRDPAAVQLIAVSKGQPAEAVARLRAEGQVCFGENRVQEARAKWPDGPPAGEELHLIGQLQSNKAEAAVRLFDAIHSVDRASLIEALARATERVGRAPRLFVQVNIGREPQKGGCDPDALGALLGHARDAGLAIEGLMCVPPADAPPLPFFRSTAALAAGHGLAGLSMGMSGDFEAAIASGATHVRVGSALFGPRQ